MRPPIPTPMPAALLLLSAVLLPAAAQVNAEALRRDAPDAPLAAEVRLGVDASAGNESLLRYRGRVRLDWQAALAGFAVGDLRRTRGSDGDLSHRGFLHLRLRRPLAGAFEAEAFAQEEFDDTRNLAERRLAGGGLRWAPPAEEGGARLSAGAGLFWEQERIDGPASWPSTLEGARASVYLSAVLPLGTVGRLRGTTYWQPRADAVADWRLLHEGALEADLGERVALAVDGPGGATAAPCRAWRRTTPACRRRWCCASRDRRLPAGRSESAVRRGVRWRPASPVEARRASRPGSGGRAPICIRHGAGDNL